MTASRTAVAVVGGGPAGAVVAALLASQGRDVTLFERSPSPRWHAAGVFTSPATVTALRAAGLSDDAVRRLARPIPSLRVETPRGTTFRLRYGDDGTLRAAAVGLNRPALDAALLDIARTAGANVRMGVGVRRIEFGRHPVVTTRDGAVTQADLVIGADGLRSVVARSAGVVRRAPLGERVGLTYHLPDSQPSVARDGRMVVLDGAYCGLAPVAGGRVNVGIVLFAEPWRRRLSARGAAAVATDILSRVPVTDDEPTGWRDAQPCDEIAGAAPLAHRVATRAGDRWLLVGDAAGFLDPFTGEGLHRALVSARLAAHHANRFLEGSHGALRAYDRAMARRFTSKDLVSRVVLAILDRPALFERVAARLARREELRDTIGLVMGDLVPASRALDPRFVAALFAP